MNERDKEFLERAEQHLTGRSVYEVFAELVRADEREECAKECEKREAYDIQIPCPDGIAGCAVCHTIRGSRVRDGIDCAKAIRTRGEVK